MRRSLLAALILVCAATRTFATVFALVHGVVHDAQHRPIAHAHLTLQAAASAFAVQGDSGADGSFTLPQVPIGLYTLTVSAPGFGPVRQPLTVASGTSPLLHIPLDVATGSASVTVRDALPEASAADTVTPTVLLTRADIDQTPGASRTESMAMITDYVPGAYMTHDMLHIRGGHQTSWLIDGIAIPNTKISSNVGPQIDPKDIDSLEVQRGSYAAGLGDRTYGVFNVLPRNGFERDRDAEFVLTGSNLSTGEAQLSFGDHTARTAWYASATGSRSSYGLETPVPAILHDATNAQSGFLSLLRNQTARDQLRLDAQFREDYFQVPYDPNPNDWEQQADYYNSYGLRDGQTERDAFVLGNWVRTLSPKAMFEAAPFYHFNQALYDSPSTDTPVATTWHQTSHYAGLQADLRSAAGPHTFSAGLYSFFQSENDLFGLTINDDTYPSSTVAPTSAQENAGLAEFHFSDHWRLGRYVTLLGGMRISSFHAVRAETAAYPRLGATLELPRLHWVFRGFYGHFFQPAPVLTVSSSFLDYVHAQPSANTFIPLPSERDEEHQFGVSIPGLGALAGWSLDIDTFQTRVNNFFDHANVGASNVFFPITVDGALIRGWETTLRSPRIGRLGQFHLVYADQIAEQRGPVTGGYSCSSSDPDNELCSTDFDYEPVDHDQRHTLNTGFTAALPLHTWLASNVSYGSGFVNGLAGSGSGPYQGDYLPAHTTFDLSAGRSFGERLSLTVTAINVTNHRVLMDNSVTIGGFHYNDPRQFSGELRYRFHF